MNIKLVVVGKLKEKFHKDEVEEYVKRLSRYASIYIVEVDEMKIKDNASLKEEENILIKEGENLLKAIKPNEYVFLLDLHGKEMSSLSFAAKMDELISFGQGNITFVIGGSLGLSNDIRNRANFKLKLSEMTFTHQMTRIIILEQIYRAFKIMGNETYHK
ncbi:MAG: 23S rRNA (pseudouridine(1915)-N(3))-methyltransferase RlmH [Bacilli bacterium]